MSQENVEAFKRVVEAGERRDTEAMLADIDPDVEWHPALLASVAGAATVYRGHEGVREFYRDIDGAFDETHFEYSEVKDLGDRILAIGYFRARGKASGADVEAPVAYLVDFRNGKATRIRTYFDPGEALEAAGLSE